MHIPDELARSRLPKNQGRLAVGLVSDDTVRHVNTSLLEPVCPVDVGGLVESSLQFNDHGDLLASLHSLDEERDDLRFLRCAIDRRLYR